MAERDSMPKWSGEPVRNEDFDNFGTAEVGRGAASADAPSSRQPLLARATPTQRAKEPAPRRRGSGFAVLGLAVLVPLALIGAGTIGYLLATGDSDSSTVADEASGNADDGSSEDAAAAATDGEDPASPSSQGGAVSVEDPSAEADTPDTSTPSTGTATTTLTPEEIQAQLNELADGDPTPRAEMGQGKLTFFGAVPNRELADLIIDGAKLDLGPDNVTDNFVVDPSSTWTPAEGLSVVVAEVVLFEVGSDEVDPGFVPVFAGGVELMERVPSVTFTIIGHTDATGSTEFNQELSEQRVQAVIDMWVGLGAESDRLIPDPRGESEASDSDDPNVQALDRRTEFIVNDIVGGPPPSPEDE